MMIYAAGGLLGAALAASQPHAEKRALCVKARGGRRYRVKTERRDKQMYVFIIDASPGEPPKMPRGPDEDDD